MKAPTALIIAVTTGVLLAATLVIPAIASQPKGSIKKLVQNQTINSKREDANSADAAIPAKTGDILKLTVEITNGGDSPMQGTRLSDTLPPGVELVSNPSTKQITQNIGTIDPGKTVTKDFIIKVTADTQETIENKACFSGNSKAEDAAQDGCDSAFIKVSSVLPPKPPVASNAPAPKPEAKKSEPEKAAPQPAPKQEEGKKPEEGKQPPAAPQGKENLPATGPVTALAPLAAISAGALGYAGHLYLAKRRQK
jgi:uncharacterized repeat protein (TIGR01451 family)